MRPSRGAASSVLIVGAGPVGLAAALELARRGHPFRIIDAEAGPTPAAESRALGILPRTLALLAPAGVDEAIRREANPVRRIELRAGDRTLATAAFAELGRPEASILVLPQSRTEHLLLAALAERGVVPEWNTRFTGFEVGSTEVTVTLAGPNGTETAPFDRVLGCDGARSTVRTVAGIPFEGTATPTEWTLADVHLSAAADPSRLVFEFLDDGGAFGRIPIDATTVRYVASRADVERLIRAEDRGGSIGWTSRFHVSYRMVPSFAKGPVLLAGDAAHVHSPVGARGMNLGIEDAAWAAWAIAEGREGDYSAARLPVARRTIAQTRALTGMVIGASPFVRFARRRLPPVVLRLGVVRRRVLARILDAGRPLPPWL